MNRTYYTTLCMIVLIMACSCRQAIAQTNKTWQLGRTLQITFSDSVNYQIQSNPLNDLRCYRFFSRPNGSICMPYTTDNSANSSSYVMDSSYIPLQPQPFLLGSDYSYYVCLFPTGFDSFTAYSHFNYQNGNENTQKRNRNL